MKSATGALDVGFLRTITSLCGVRVFVETGTYRGDTAATAAEILDQVYTIELSADLASQAAARLAAYKNVKVIRGDSSQALPQIVSALTDRALFWLDGHYSEGNTALGKSGNTPILDELRALRQAGLRDSILLVDDLRMFDSPVGARAQAPSLSGYPELAALRQAVTELAGDYRFVVFGDVALAYPGRLAITTTPLLQALTVSRLYEGGDFSPQEVCDAEDAIVRARPDERAALQQLHEEFAGAETYGLGWHYRYWLALTCIGEGRFAEAAAHLRTLVAAGFDHWRVQLRLAHALRAMGEAESARELAQTLASVLPDCAPVKAMLDEINGPCRATPIGSRPVLQSGQDARAQLAAAGLWREGHPLRLHLGCGEQYFDGYVNLDYPPAAHNVMNVKADAFADVTALTLTEGSVDEIRLHHVFEHFNRVTALALLIQWHRALKIGGALRIETPDLAGSARAFLDNASFKVRMGQARQLAGDQAATWAYHVDHWFPERFERTLKRLGFDQIKTVTSAWPREPFLANVEVTAAKATSRTLTEQLAAGDELLWDSTVADTEKPTYEVWKQQLRAVLAGAKLPPPVNVIVPDVSAAADAIRHLGVPASRLPLEEIHNFNQLERDRWVKAKAATVPCGARVLDVGAGTCPYRAFFTHCDYRAHDFKNYKGVKLGNTYDYGQIDIVPDISAIPLPDGTFDLVLCTEVLEHVPEPAVALREMARLLVPGGRLLLTAPLGSGLHQLPYHFYGGFTPEWYRHFAASCKLRVVEITPNGGFFRLLAQECARVAWTLPDHRHLHGRHESFIRNLFGDWLPRYLFGLEEKYFNDQFTVGYHVELVKMDAGA